MNRLEIFNEADRLTVAAILVKNNYTVKQSKRKRPGKRSYLYYLDYEKQGDGAVEEEPDEG